MDLLLIPTETEWQFCKGLYSEYCGRRAVRQELCGWGPIQSGIRTMMLLGQYRPSRVWLLGIAGSLSEELQLGQAYDFNQVAVQGVGVGTGDQHVSFQSLGWAQKFGDLGAPRDVIQLNDASDQRSQFQRLQILTVCSVSADSSEADSKRRAHPLASAEDMESYAVASACRLMKSPLRVIRGISNRAGDRDHSGWRSEQAMIAAFELAADCAGWKEC